MELKSLENGKHMPALMEEEEDDDDEALECIKPNDPALIADFQAWAYCKATLRGMGFQIAKGATKGTISTIGYCTGIGQAWNAIKSVGQLCAAGGMASVGKGKKAAKYLACAADSARGIVDPTTWVADIADGVTQCSSSRIFSSTRAFLAVYAAMFAGETPPRNPAFQPLTEHRRWRDRIPSSSIAPLLRMMKLDIGVPRRVKVYIDRITQIGHFKWRNFHQIVMDSFTAHPLFAARLATLGYSSVAQACTCGAMDGAVINSVMPQDEINSIAKKYFTDEYN